MFVKIKENGEEAELKITDKGIEWTQDLLGTAGVLGDPKYFYRENGDDLYTCSLDTWAWWEAYILGVNIINERLEAVRSTYGDHWGDALEQCVNKAIGQAGQYAEHFNAATCEIDWFLFDHQGQMDISAKENERKKGRKKNV